MVNSETHPFGNRELGRADLYHPLDDLWQELLPDGAWCLADALLPRHKRGRLPVDLASDTNEDVVLDLLSRCIANPVAITVEGSLSSGANPKAVQLIFDLDLVQKDLFACWSRAWGHDLGFVTLRLHSIPDVPHACDGVGLSRVVVSFYPLSKTWRRIVAGDLARRGDDHAEGCFVLAEESTWMAPESEIRCQLPKAMAT